MQHLISADELERLRDRPELVIVDCRFNLLAPAAGRAAYREGHIPGAVYADLDRDLAATPAAGQGRHPLPEPQAVAALAERLGISNSSLVVAYDDAAGAIAARLWWMLRWIGHEAVAVLDGGIDAWLRNGGAPEPGECVAAAASFEPRPVDRRAIVTTEDLPAALQAGAVLLDARAPARFRGEVEPIDPVSGHVPGAVNLPFDALLGSDRRFLSPARLRDAFETAIGGNDAANRDVICMCGSGVTACHLLLGLAQAGLAAGRLYAGSWSEWIRDPDRPVAKT